MFTTDAPCDPVPTHALLPADARPVTAINESRQPVRAATPLPRTAQSTPPHRQEERLAAVASKARRGAVKESDPWTAPAPLTSVPRRRRAETAPTDGRISAPVNTANGVHLAQCGCKMCIKRARLFQWRDEMAQACVP